MGVTADRYAKALFELACEQKSLEAVETTLTDIRKLIAEVTDFRHFLINPLLSYEERSLVLKALFDGKVPELAYKFLIFITYKDRLSILGDVIESFDNMYLSTTHQVRAYVKTALPVDEQEKIFIHQQLKAKFRQEVLIRWTTDSSLVGGFRIFTQGKLYDYSFKGQLNSFYQQTI